MQLVVVDVEISYFVPLFDVIDAFAETAICKDVGL
jgi:hypothetical protein